MSALRTAATTSRHHERRRERVMHQPTERSEPGEVGDAPMLDIGGDVGAVVVQLDAIPQTGELEACPRARPDLRFHTGVHWRDIGRRRIAVAVYPTLTAGYYEILDPELRPLGCVQVEGGRVAELRLTPRVSAG